MKRRGLLAVMAGFAALVGVTSYAQAPTPTRMVEHYRVYAAAEARGDYVAAHDAAVSALAAAQAEGSDKVGVLATNLARLRAFRLRKLAEAREPALLAQRSGGVDAEQADLLVALTQLGADGAGRILQTKLDAYAQSAEADPHFLFDVSQAWGVWALDARRFEQAVAAFTRAADHAAKLGPAQAFYRGSALTSLGASYLYSGNARKSDEVLHQAGELLQPLAFDGDGNPVPKVETLYYTAVAWHAAMEAKLTSEGKRVPRNVRAPQRADDQLPLCDYRIVQTPRITYPRTMVNELAVGAVVARYAVEEDGRIHSVQVLATAPPSAVLAQAVMEAVPNWRLEWRPGAQPCRRQRDVAYFTFPFVIQ